MTVTLAITNQKGGVGKTTSAVNIASYLATHGYRTLLIDFDPQGNATSGLGVEMAEEGEDLFDLFFGRVSLNDIIRESVVPHLHVAPSSRDLIGVEIELGKSAGRELILASEVKRLASSYDFILIDCPPASGLLTLNALGAADQVIVPLQAEYYALEGLSSLMDTIHFVQQTFNPELSILGVFVTMYDGRTNLARDVLKEVKAHFGKTAFKTIIPRSIRLSESPSHGVPINLYDPSGPGAKAYKALTLEIERRCKGRVSKGAKLKAKALKDSTKGSVARGSEDIRAQKVVNS